MRIPIYEEIKLEHHDIESISTVLKEKDFGQVPFFISTSEIDKNFISEALDNISEVLITLNINLKLPYPIYIISLTKINHPELTILDSVNDLPTHFFNKARRLKTKEKALLSKISLIASKISNENVPQILDDLKDILKPQRRLYEVSKELYFYETILDGLSGKLDKQNHKKE
ncbi:MAG: hypothetical protein HN576_13930 [Bacteriovoracaceae bacterium]|jgi:hypothetical protein|nr:hypothetical protein [Bacteriovoracaceae bacterium]